MVTTRKQRAKEPYRLRITHNGCPTYIERGERDGRVSYFSGSETPLALSNLLQARSAETRFQLSDALDGSEAKHVLVKVFSEIWRDNKPMQPMVEVLTND